MSLPADIVLFDEFGRTLLMAEVKVSKDTTPSWAAEARKDVLRGTRDFVPPYFLVIAPDTTYFWASDAAPDAIPDESVSTQELFREILDNVGSSAADLAGSPLELVAGIWLRDLTRNSRKPIRAVPRLSGLAAAAENGRIQFAAAA